MLATTTGAKAITTAVEDSGRHLRVRGNQAVDRGSQAVDSGSQAVDSGNQVVDSGSQAVDRGSQAGDSGSQFQALHHLRGHQAADKEGSPAVDSGSQAVDSGSQLQVLHLLHGNQAADSGSPLRGRLNHLRGDHAAGVRILTPGVLQYAIARSHMVAVGISGSALSVFLLERLLALQYLRACAER